MDSESVPELEREAAIGRVRLAHFEGRLDVEEFDDRLGRVYAATTAGELAVVVGDLPGVPPPPEPLPVETRWVVGVLGGARRTGRWRPDRSVRAVAVLGSAVVDLTEVDLGGEGVGLGDRFEVVAVAVLGGVEVLVPEGVDVELGGVAVLGSKLNRVRSGTVAGAPLVRVRTRAVLGGVTVRAHRFRRFGSARGCP